MNPVEGQIQIDLYPHSHEDTVVEITSSRPLQAQKIFIGKTPEQALAIIPLMYNICATAQARAALKSLQQSLQAEPDPKADIARDILLLVEMAKEHLLRIFIDWPDLLDIVTARKKLTFISQLGTDFKSALFTHGQAFSLESKLEINQHKIKKLVANLEQQLSDQVFSLSTRDWLACDNLAAIQQWSQQSDTVASQSLKKILVTNRATEGVSKSRHLPQLHQRQLLKHLNQEDAGDFIAQPQWQGHCYETTALSRQLQHPLIQSLYPEYQNALLTRWLARLVELAKIPQQLARLMEQLNGRNFEPMTKQQGSHGLAEVESARGRLVHRTEIKQGLITRYQILAPTEWNFHPQGVLAQSLASLKTYNRKELKQLARLIINAIDPCVGYELRIH